MEFLKLWPWLLSGGGVIALVLAVLNPAAALRVASSLSGLLLDLVHRAVAWLREPHDWWRIAATVGGIGCLVLGLALTEARREVVTVATQCAVDVRTAQAATEAANTLADDRGEAVATCLAQLDLEVGVHRQVAEASDKALAAAASAEAAAKLTREAWQRSYSSKPATCTAALSAMEAACSASIPSY